VTLGATKELSAWEARKSELKVISVTKECDSIHGQRAYLVRSQAFHRTLGSKENDTWEKSNKQVMLRLYM